MSVIIGVYIDESHVSSAAVDSDNLIIAGTYFRTGFDSMASEKIILKKWAEVINQTIDVLIETDIIHPYSLIRIAFSIPGSFKYETGIAMFEGNGEYEALHNIVVSNRLFDYLSTENISFRLLNNASCLGIGNALNQESNRRNNASCFGVKRTLAQESVLRGNKIIAITLDNGFGSAFLYGRFPSIKGNNVPDNGSLWDKPFLDSIADHYFSTSWFVNYYENSSGNKIAGGVKEITDLENDLTIKIFDDFAYNLSEFLAPYILDFTPDLLILGGKIAKSHKFFLSQFQENLKRKNIDLPISIIGKTERTSIIGASYLYNDALWERIKIKLPYF
ncbi:MAG: ROK family protein [Flavobacterium sp.]